MAGGSSEHCHSVHKADEPQWSPGLMAGGSGVPCDATPDVDGVPQWSPWPDGLGKAGDVADVLLNIQGPQWSPGLMAGGSRRPDRHADPPRRAAMEPRPDGRGKPAALRAALDLRATPQWSPGLMAGGRSRPRRVQSRSPTCRNGAPA